LPVLRRARQRLLDHGQRGGDAGAGGGEDRVALVGQLQVKKPIGR
jgi:hypothetical protein